MYNTDDDDGDVGDVDCILCFTTKGTRLPILLLLLLTENPCAILLIMQTQDAIKITVIVYILHTVIFADFLLFWTNLFSYSWML
mmetsp:Transcript_7062/g.9560  ORF Transcript_7062/g.9560 Transcript_7062/m.9560 type:complete len:84 (+) Transcript_7062:594-845(+)